MILFFMIVSLFSRSFLVFVIFIASVMTSPLFVFVLPAYRSYRLLLKNDRESICSMLHYWYSFFLSQYSRVATVLLHLCLLLIGPFFRCVYLSFRAIHIEEKVIHF